MRGWTATSLPSSSQTRSKMSRSSLLRVDPRSAVTISERFARHNRAWAREIAARLPQLGIERPGAVWLAGAELPIARVRPKASSDFPSGGIPHSRDFSSNEASSDYLQSAGTLKEGALRLKRNPPESAFPASCRVPHSRNGGSSRESPPGHPSPPAPVPSRAPNAS